jgi:hypothetical protein
MYRVRTLLFLLIFLFLIVTVADRLRYVNPNIQTRLLAASTLVPVLTYVVYDFVLLMFTTYVLMFCSISVGSLEDFFSSGSTVMINLTFDILFSLIGCTKGIHTSVLSVGCLLHEPTTNNR